VTSSPTDDGPALLSAAVRYEGLSLGSAQAMTRLIRSKRLTDPAGNDVSVSLTPR
jgi:hypothetical protein